MMMMMEDDDDEDDDDNNNIKKPLSSNILIELSVSYLTNILIIFS